jgi:hypothetical protein
MTHPNVTDGSRGDTLDLGIVTVRLLAVADQTNGAFALGEFSGGEGPWTVPHVHQHTESPSMSWTAPSRSRSTQTR